MSILDKNILSFLSKIKWRIRANVLIDILVLGGIAASTLGAFITMLSLFIPIYNAFIFSIYLILLGLFISMIVSVFKFPNDKKSAMIADSKGLKERLITSLEFIGKEDGFSHIQKEDTVKALNQFNYKKSLPIKVDRKKLLILGLVVSVLITCGFIPSDTKEKAEQNHKFNQMKKEKTKKIEETQKHIEKLKTLTEEEKKELKKVLEKAKQEVKVSQDKKEIEKALERLDKKIEKQAAKQELKKLSEALSKDEKTKKLSEAIQKQDKKEIQQELSNIKQAVSNMNESDKSDVSSALNSAALASNRSQLKQALAKAAKETKKGKISEDTMSEIQDSISELNEDTGASVSSSDGQGQGNSQGAGQGQGEGRGQGSGQGSGQGGGQSSGAGGSRGSGAGSGAGWNQGSQQGFHRPGSAGNTGENVFIPGRQNGNDGNLTGQKNQGGNSTSQVTSDSLAQRGESISYDKVVGEYTDRAMESMHDTNIPDVMKDVIKEYFDSLNE